MVDSSLRECRRGFNDVLKNMQRYCVGVELQSRSEISFCVPSEELHNTVNQYTTWSIMKKALIFRPKSFGLHIFHLSHLGSKLKLSLIWPKLKLSHLGSKFELSHIGSKLKLSHLEPKLKLDPNSSWIQTQVVPSRTLTQTVPEKESRMLVLRPEGFQVRNHPRIWEQAVILLPRKQKIEV